MGGTSRRQRPRQGRDRLAAGSGRARRSLPARAYRPAGVPFQPLSRRRAQRARPPQRVLPRARHGSQALHARRATRGRPACPQRCAYPADYGHRRRHRLRVLRAGTVCCQPTERRLEKTPSETLRGAVRKRVPGNASNTKGQAMLARVNGPSRTTTPPRHWLGARRRTPVDQNALHPGSSRSPGTTRTIASTVRELRGSRVRDHQEENQYLYARRESHGAARAPASSSDRVRPCAASWNRPGRSRPPIRPCCCWVRRAPARSSSPTLHSRTERAAGAEPWCASIARRFPIP